MYIFTSFYKRSQVLCNLSQIITHFFLLKFVNLQPPIKAKLQLVTLTKVASPCRQSKISCPRFLIFTISSLHSRLFLDLDILARCLKSIRIALFFKKPFKHPQQSPANPGGNGCEWGGVLKGGHRGLF